MVGLVSLTALLGLIDVGPGLGQRGWTAGLLYGAVVTLLLVRSLHRHGMTRLGPATSVTLARAVLVGGATALVTDAVHPSTAAVATVVGLSATTLALDAVDGLVARRTGTVTHVGARFDMEVDAFLIVVLSVEVSRALGPWVLLIGGARYAFWLAGWALPWLRGPLPARHWRKVVAAVQGVVLTVLASGVVPSPIADLLATAALALLAESFGRDVLILWRARRTHRGGPPRGGGPEESGPEESGSGESGEPPSAVATTRARARSWRAAPAVVVVWLVLVVPSDPGSLTPWAVAHLPGDGLVLVAVGALVGGLAGRVLWGVAGAVLGAALLVKLLDVGFGLALHLPFDPVTDLGYAASTADLVTASVGRPVALVVAVGVVLVLLAVLLVVVTSTARLGRLLREHDDGSARVATALAAGWLACAAFVVPAGPDGPVASTDTVGLTVRHAQQLVDRVRDEKRFSAALTSDPMAGRADSGLLSHLRGKDVLVVFVESYGRVALEDPQVASTVGGVLDRGTARLQRAGFSARSAYVESPTFGGVSWLAHSTLQSGLWVDSQSRYDRLVASDHTTLSALFRRAGWRTACVVPANHDEWAAGRTLYRCDTIYDADHVGYVGPRFGYGPVPDQYALAAVARNELGPRPRTPVMAEIDLVSSHVPWTPLPRIVPWHELGDGSVYADMPSESAPRDVVWRDADGVRRAYAESIAYSWNSLLTFLEHTRDDDLVLLVLGDHQPSTPVTSSSDGHEVPVSVIARDPAVVDRVGAWGWESGLRPRDDAPVWRMDALRGRFVDTFSAPRARARSASGSEPVDGGPTVGSAPTEPWTRVTP